MKVFDSMEQAVQEFGAKSCGAWTRPLTDSSGASDWAAAKLKADRRGWAKEWEGKMAKAREHRSLGTEAFLSIMSYEAHGAKFEETMGWPALGLWLEALKESGVARGGVKNQFFERQELAELAVKLIQTGASVEAFQALYPNALQALLTEMNPKGSPLRDWACLLLGYGWDPGQWTPAMGEEGCSSMQALLWSCPSIGGDAPKACWTAVAKAAMGAGFDLEARSASGLTALGGCVAAGSGISPREDDGRAAALLDLGADPKRAGPFWICSFESAPSLREQMLGRMEAEQIDAASNAGSAEPGSHRRQAL